MNDARQRAGHGGRGGLFPRRRSERGGGEGGEFRESDFAHRANDTAQRARPIPVGRPAFATRYHQPKAAGNYRQTNRAVGHQSHGGGSEGSGIARKHETCDGQTSRGRTRTPGESRECRRRISGRRENGASRGVDRQRTDYVATTLPPDHARNGERTQHNHLSAAADRLVLGVFEEIKTIPPRWPNRLPPATSSAAKVGRAVLCPPRWEAELPPAPYQL